MRACPVLATHHPPIAHGARVRGHVQECACAGCTSGSQGARRAPGCFVGRFGRLPRSVGAAPAVSTRQHDGRRSAGDKGREWLYGSMVGSMDENGSRIGNRQPNRLGRTDERVSIQIDEVPDSDASSRRL